MEKNSPRSTFGSSVKFLTVSLTFAIAASASWNALGAVSSIATIVSSKGGALIRSERSGGKPVRVAKTGDEVFEGDTINTSSSASVKLLMIDKTVIDIGASALFHVKKVEGGGPGRKIEIGLPYGSARAAVSKPLGPGGEFKVRSSAATMGVRGTEFVIQSPLESPSQVSGSSTSQGSARAPTTTVTVLQGLVAVEQNQTKSENPKGGAVAENKPAPKPVLVPAGSQVAAKMEEPPASKDSSANAGSASGAVAPAAPQVVRLEPQALSAVSTSVEFKVNAFSDAVTLDTSGNPGGESASSSSESGERAPAGSATAGSAPAPSISGGAVANVTASLILDTFVAPPASIAAVTAPQAIAQSVAQASFSGGVSNSSVVASVQNIAPITAGGISTTRRLTVIIGQ